MDVTIKSRILPAVMKLIESGDRFNRAEAEDYNVMVIGVPNVGKSSLINALRHVHLKKGGKATPVGARPGVTRSVMEKIRVSDQPKIYVYDSPGIMLPHIPNMDVGTLQDHLIGTMTIADYLLFMLNKLSYFKYTKHFGLDEPTDEIYGLLSHIAKQNNLILKTRSTAGGYVYRTNFVRAGEIFIRDFRAGLLGKVNLDADQLASMSDSSKSDSSKETKDAVTFTENNQTKPLDV